MVEAERERTIFWDFPVLVGFNFCVNQEIQISDYTLQAILDFYGEDEVLRYLNRMSKTLPQRQFQERIIHLCDAQNAAFDQRDKSLEREVQELRDEVALLRRSLRDAALKEEKQKYSFTRKSTSLATSTSTTIPCSSRGTTTSISTTRFLPATLPTRPPYRASFSSYHSARRPQQCCYYLRAV
jgi:hypothetical protein